MSVRHICEKLMGAQRHALQLLALSAVLLLAFGTAQRVQAGQPSVSAKTAATSVARNAAVRPGSVPTRDGLQLTLTVDSGSVRIFTDAHGEVRYGTHVEGQPNGGVAKEFSLRARSNERGVILEGRTLGAAVRGVGAPRITYEVHVPRRYNLTISTQAGDIIAQDVDGRVVLTTGGGNIQTGRTGTARLETGGGHILTGDVAGTLRATTAGGHITAGNVDGDALLHTEGGHIQVGQVRGATQLKTGGGNISAERAGDGVVAETTGGRIEFGEAAGAIHVRTGGGGIRIARVVAPTELFSSGGGIILAGVEAPLHVSAAAGAITARFSPQFKAVPMSSELASGQGDIVVYVPRELALTIDALVERGSDHRIVADPSFALKVRSEDSASGHSLRAQANLNGGGKVLRLKTGAGDIQLRFLDADTERRLAGQQAAMIEQALAGRKALLLEMQQQNAPGNGSVVAQATQIEPPTNAAQVVPGGFAAFTRIVEGFWWGGVRVDPDEQQKRLMQAVKPEYPGVARDAGLEGDVTLRVEVGPDGSVRDVTPISGHPELVRPAMNAVAQWRYAPALLDRRPVSVVTTVTLAFRLK